MNLIQKERTFEVALIGDVDVGKSEFTHSSQFKMRKYPVEDLEYYRFQFETNHGPVALNLLCYEDRHLGWTMDHIKTLWPACHGAIGMFDLSNQATQFHLGTRMSLFNKIFPSVPVVICGNKKDIRTIKPENLTLHQKLGEKWGRKIISHSISVKKNQGLNLPFETLIKEMTGHSDLRIITSPEE